ncbi:hypothetical protein C8F04DRAFT_1265072 [Mycena alexandri]|uniref:Uncharacterized protein n=1 Tax=Mycena alexandri TaxID=1745969 RepID=A0AAD6SK00_9AGAR|nr:hypothetical protein C8F04DRAFT_1265072 [Mycena alexandri]
MPKRHRTPSSSESESETSGSERETGASGDLDGMSRAQLKEVVRTAQLEKNKAQKQLRHAFGDLTNRDGDSPPMAKQKKRKKTKNTQKQTKRRRIEPDSSDKGREQSNSSESESDSGSDTDADTRTKKVESLGRRFVLVKGLWLKEGVFEAKVDPNYNEKKRFDGAEVQGQLRDLLGIVPEHFKGHIMQEGWFKRAVSPALLDLLTPALRGKFREEIGWNGQEYASLDVPLLHEDGSATYEIHTCFLSPVPMRLFVALIRGPSAAAAMLKDVSIPKTDSMENIHDIDHSEPAAIAAACTSAIWGKSVDVHLRARRDTTNIDYEARFEDGTGSFSPDAKASFVDPKRKKNIKSSGFRRAMAAMRAEAGPDGDEGNSAQEGGGNEGDDEAETARRSEDLE